MKIKILLVLLLTLFIHLRNYGQYEINDFQVQMQVQRFQQEINGMLTKINKEHSCYCVNGKKIACSFTISRVSGGFINPVAIIQNAERTKSKPIEISSNLGTHVSVYNFGNDDWELAYGDKITISTDGNVSVTFNIGVDDNMSKISWNAYKDLLINESKQQIQRNIVKNSVNQQINISPIVYPTIDTYKNSSSSNKLVRVTCSSCNGNRVQESPSYGASYGLDRTSNNRCSVCGKYENHYHANCIPCQGKGYTEKYVP